MANAGDNSVVTDIESWDATFISNLDKRTLFDLIIVSKLCFHIQNILRTYMMLYW